jgi:hypothetical protein
MDQFQTLSCGARNYARTTGSVPMRTIAVESPRAGEKITVIEPEEWILGEWSAEGSDPFSEAEDRRTLV